MKFIIRHESDKRMRVHFAVSRMTYKEADILLYFLNNTKNITFAKVYERTADAVIEYKGKRTDIINTLRRFHYEDIEVPAVITDNSSRQVNAEYQEKLVTKIALHYATRFFIPLPVRALMVISKSFKYIGNGIRTLLRHKIEVPVLDATAIGVSILRDDIGTAGSIMFMLGIGEILEEWTHKKSVGDLARSMSLNISKVWLSVDGKEVLVSSNDVKPGDKVVVHMGNVIPFDGKVYDGEAMVNQASLTGESVAVRKAKDAVVYAGTVVEEGEITILVNQTKNSSRFEKIVAMIEESEKLKSGLESKAEHLADRLVPYSLGGTILTYLLTRNVTKALSILMVDFSCALKLAMPISVLSAIREANAHDITVKGGKFLEAMAEADTIVFDKTGTLTKARPTVADVVSFNGETPDELLRTAACLEEHFPHSMAKAVVNAAMEKNLQHEEMHTKVEYVVAHGISTMINNKKVIIGSYHFVFEDEKSIIPEDKKDLFNTLPEEYSHLYMAIDGTLAAVICIEDPLRKEAEDVVRKLHKAGFTKIVMMTGDSERTAKAVAGRVGVDEYYSEVLPEDKAGFIEKEKAAGRKVVMIGDGINDSPALSAADVGIAISDGAEIAREIADITIGADDLYRVVTLKNLSDALMRRIGKNYRTIVGFNSMLILLGVAGVIQPTTSALLHNSSTLLIGLSLLIDLVASATKSLVLVDNYVDVGTLNILPKKKENVSQL